MGKKKSKRPSLSERRERKALAELDARIQKTLRFHQPDVCLVQEQWEEMGLAMVFVCRKRPDDGYSYVSFIVDLNVLGLKEWDFKNNVNLDDLQFTSPGELIEIDRDSAAKIVQAGYNYAKSFDLPQPAEYEILIKALADADPESSEIEVELGVDGRPFYMVGPHDDQDAILAMLDEKIGPGNYDLLTPDAIGR